MDWGLVPTGLRLLLFGIVGLVLSGLGLLAIFVILPRVFPGGLPDVLTKGRRENLIAILETAVLLSGAAILAGYSLNLTGPRGVSRRMVLSLLCLFLSGTLTGYLIASMRPATWAAGDPFPTGPIVLPYIHAFALFFVGYVSLVSALRAIAVRCGNSRLASACRAHIVVHAVICGYAAVVTCVVIAARLWQTRTCDALGLLFLALVIPHFLWLLGLLHGAIKGIDSGPVPNRS